MREPRSWASHVRNLSPPPGLFNDGRSRSCGSRRRLYAIAASAACNGPRGEAPILCIAQVKRSEPRERSAGLGNVFALNKPHPKPRQRRPHKAYRANRRSRRTRSMREQPVATCRGFFNDGRSRSCGSRRRLYAIAASAACNGSRGEAPFLCIAQVKRSASRERSAGLGNVFALNKPHPKPRQRRPHKAYGANRRSRRTRSMREPRS